MDEGRQTAVGLGVGDPVADVHAALLPLQKAYDLARDVQCDPWEFAIEIDRLVSLGLTVSDLRWMVRKGHIRHAVEVTRSGDPVRRFEPGANLAFSRRTCFVLAESSSPAAGPALVPRPCSVDTLGATAGLSSSAENTVGQANRGTRHFRSGGALGTHPWIE